eukprot:COSAG06_NODE_3354_length_5468_cov_10.052710_6_plen_92_part_00
MYSTRNDSPKVAELDLQVHVEVPHRLSIYLHFKWIYRSGTIVSSFLAEQRRDHSCNLQGKELPPGSDHHTHDMHTDDRSVQSSYYASIVNR